MDLSPATRRTTTIRRSQKRDRFFLLLPGLVLLAGFVLVLRGGFHPGESEIRFSNFVSPETATEQAAHNELSVGETARREGRDALTSIQLPEADIDSESAVPVSPTEYVITIEDEDGNPVPHARVNRVEIGRVTVAAAPDGGTELFGPFSEQTMSANEKGELAFQASERGNRYELVVEVEGYATKHYRLRDPGKRYRLQLHRSASIAGRVTDVSRQPLAGILVELWHDINRNESTVTDENGDYEFKEVTPTTATIRIQNAAYRRARQHVVVVEGRIKYFRDFVLDQGLHLDVTVVDPDNRPLSLAEVRLVELESGLVVGKQQTSTSGGAVFDCLHPDRHYMAIATSLTSGGGRGIVAPFGDLESQSLTIQTRELWTFYGLVQTQDGLPLAGTQVVIESEAFDGASSTSKDMFVVSTDEEGRFFVPNLDPTLDYAALIYHQQFAMQQLEQINPYTLSEDAAAPDTVVPTAEEPQVIDLEPAASMEGVIVGPGGQLMANSIIYLSAENDHLRSLPGGQISLRTDSKGRFYIGNLAAGNYQVEARHLSTGLTTEHFVIGVRSGESLRQQWTMLEK